MQVAELSLCKQLYELSGWDTASKYLWIEAHQEYDIDNGDTFNQEHPAIPAYDAGFLLRKLPRQIGSYWLRMITPFTTDWRFDYFDQGSQERLWSNTENKADSMCVADTPEDALCRLAVELFKEGVLTKSQEETR